MAKLIIETKDEEILELLQDFIEKLRMLFEVGQEDLTTRLKG